MILTNIPSSVTIVAATKTRSTEVISAYCASVVASHIGENYVQEWESKHDKVKGAPIKHLIGHLQSNKAKKAVELFDVIQSIDSVKIAEAVAKEASKINKVQAVMIQVNISEDEKKSGTATDSINQLIEKIISNKNLKLVGLMCITAAYSNQEDTRKDFKKMFELYSAVKNKYKFPEFQLSMGMSSDYELAISEGSTMVRLGTVLFGSR